MSIANVLSLVLLALPSARSVESVTDPAPEVVPALPEAVMNGCSFGEVALTLENGVKGWIAGMLPNRSRQLTCWWSSYPVRIEQKITMSAYPTALLVRSPTSWLVAGKRSDGTTVLEAWTVALPVLEHDAGGEVVRISEAVVTRVDTLYEERTEGRDVILLMCSMPASGYAAGAEQEERQAILLQFWDSKDVYELDLVTRGLKRVASPRKVPDALHVPELTFRHADMYTANHGERGFIYVLRKLGSSTPAVVLEDSDRDGTIDGSVVPGDGRCATYGSGSSYVR